MDIQKRQIFEFLKKLNLGIKNKKRYVITNRFKGCDLLLIYLFEMRLIKNYKIKDQYKFIVELSYDSKGNSIIRGIRRSSLYQYKKHMRLKDLRQIISKKILIYPFFETRNGLLPLFSCIKYKIGGMLLFWIY